MPYSWPVAPRSLQGTKPVEPIAETAVRRPSECSPTSPIPGRLSLGRPGPWRIVRYRHWVLGFIRERQRPLASVPRDGASAPRRPTMSPSSIKSSNQIENVTDSARVESVMQRCNRSISDRMLSEAFGRVIGGIGRDRVRISSNRAVTSWNLPSWRSAAKAGRHHMRSNLPSIFPLSTFFSNEMSRARHFSQVLGE